MSRGGTRGHTRVRTGRGRTSQSVRWLERQLNDPYVKKAKAEGSGVASLNGKMVDLPVVNRAKTTLQLAAKLGMAEEDLEA